MKLLTFGSLLAVFGVLTGCVTTGPDGVEIETATRKAISGERTKLGRGWKLNRDCTSAGLPRAYIVVPPKHGKMEFVTEKLFPTSAKGPYAKCQNVKVEAVVGYYTSAPGYVGKDEVKIRMSYGDGRIRDYVTQVDVLK